MKPEAVSRQFVLHQEALEKEKPILLSACIVGSLTWEIEKLMQEAQQNEPDLGSGLTGPRRSEARSLTGAHAARFACHPGKNRTIQFPHHLF